jgi:hypothetical protein
MVSIQHQIHIVNICLELRDLAPLLLTIPDVGGATGLSQGRDLGYTQD